MEGTRIKIKVGDYVDIGFTYNEKITKDEQVIIALKEFISMMESPVVVDPNQHLL